jgi:SWI/SNF-related matrix-associated actin-dependent regulator of chromatin subfamily A member 5
MASWPMRWGEFFCSWAHWSRGLVSTTIYFAETFPSVQSIPDTDNASPMLLFARTRPSLSRSGYCFTSYLLTNATIFYLFVLLCLSLGKTLQSISVLVYMHEYQNSFGPHLIVVPKSTLSNWMAELKRWAPELSAVRFHGTKDEREEMARNVLCPGQRDEERSWNVCVTTYEVCNMDRNVLNKFAWSYLIIDEAHRLKNEASTFSRTIRTFETRYRLLLTGTPLQNNLHELWALLNFLVPDVFASAEQFDDWFNLDIDDDNEKNKLISQLHKILRPFMLRRLKVDVEKSLPPKHETILFTGMSKMQKKLYKDILMRDLDVIQGKSGASGRTAVLNIVMQLRKCAGHPYLFPGVEDRTLPPLGEHLVEN